MTGLSFGIEGKDHHGVIRDPHVHRKGVHNGLVVYTQPFLNLNPGIHPFLNPVHGVAMNQNVGFGGTPEIIHDGGTSSAWTGTAVQGTWNFADGGKFSITSANNQDEATFLEGSSVGVDTSGFKAFTGKVNLTAYNEVNNGISISFDLGGVQVGDTLDLETFIDTGLIGVEQNFAIDLDVFNFPTDVVDGFTILISRSGGQRPTIVFDDFQLEETGEPLEFKSTASIGTEFYVTEVRVSLADALTGIVTVAGATESHSLAGLSYNKILGLSSLTNGIIFKRSQDGKIESSLTFRQLGDFLGTESELINLIGDGVNTYFTLLMKFPEPIILCASTGDFLSFTINDDLSGLLQFAAVARGAVVEPQI